MLKQSGGNVTPKHVLRCAQMSGPNGRQLDEIFPQSGLGDMDVRDCHQRIPAYKVDVVRCLQDYQNDNLCSYQPGKMHRGMRDFTYPRKLRKSHLKLRIHLKQLARNLDNFRALAIRQNLIDT